MIEGQDEEKAQLDAVAEKTGIPRDALETMKRMSTEGKSTENKKGGFGSLSAADKIA